MQFTFYEYDYDLDDTFDVPATGWAIRDAGKNETEYGFHVLKDDGSSSMTFLIPELRQMLAEAEEIRDKYTGKATGNGACDCDAFTFAPLADEDDLSKDFKDRVEAAVSEDTDTLRSILIRAETKAASGDYEGSKALIDLAFARSALLR